MYFTRNVFLISSLWTENLEGKIALPVTLPACKHVIAKGASHRSMRVSITSGIEGSTEVSGTAILCVVNNQPFIFEAVGSVAHDWRHVHPTANSSPVVCLQEIGMNTNSVPWYMLPVTWPGLSTYHTYLGTMDLLHYICHLRDLWQTTGATHHLNKRSRQSNDTHSYDTYHLQNIISYYEPVYRQKWYINCLRFFLKTPVFHSES